MNNPMDYLLQLLKGSQPDKTDEEIKLQADSMNSDKLSGAMGSLMPQSSFDVDRRTAPVTQNGNLDTTANNFQLSPDSMTSPMPLEAAFGKGDINAGMKQMEPEAPKRPQWSIEEDALPTPETLGGGAKSPKPLADLSAITASSDNDNAARKALLEKQKKSKGIDNLTSLAAGAGDAIAGAASAFGATAKGGAQERLEAKQKQGYADESKQFEEGLQNDPNSDVSKAYRALILQVVPELGSDSNFNNMSAKAIGERLPLIDRVIKSKSDKELKEMMMEQRRQSMGTKEPAETTAQKAVDRTFGKTYEDFVVSGGYGKALSQLDTLEGVQKKLKKGKGNLSGAGFAAVPGFVEKVAFPNKVETQQAVEQAIQEGLRATLGAQFTEKEGERFLARAWDPNLDEAQNEKKLERAINQLKLMIIAKKKAADYYEDNGTLKGFKGDMYTIKDGVMTAVAPDAMEGMLQDTPGVGPRKTKSGITYTQEG